MSGFSKICVAVELVCSVGDVNDVVLGSYPLACCVENNGEVVA